MHTYMYHTSSKTLAQNDYARDSPNFQHSISMCVLFVAYVCDDLYRQLETISVKGVE